MKNRPIQIGLLLLVFISCFSLNYNPQLLLKLTFGHWGWIFAAMASFLKIGLMKLRDPTSWKQKLGINFSVKDIFKFALLLAILIIISFYLVDYLTKRNGFTFEPQLIHYKKYFGVSFPFHLVLSNYLYYFF